MASSQHELCGKSTLEKRENGQEGESPGTTREKAEKRGGGGGGTSNAQDEDCEIGTILSAFWWSLFSNDLQVSSFGTGNYQWLALVETLKGRRVTHWRVEHARRQS